MDAGERRTFWFVAGAGGSPVLGSAEMARYRIDSATDRVLLTLGAYSPGHYEWRSDDGRNHFLEVRREADGYGRTPEEAVELEVQRQSVILQAGAR